MEGKRGNDSQDGIDYKRAKTEFPLDLVLNGEDVEAFNVTKSNVTRGVFVEKAAFSPASDLRLVKKDGEIQDLINQVRSVSYPPAPAVINDIGFFQDALRKKHYQVEMRGERTVDGVYVKIKDVGDVLGNPNICDHVQQKHTQAQEDVDYLRLMVVDEEKNTSKCELFFTFIGLLRAIFRARSPVAEELCIWVCETIFCVGFGTQEQKQQLAKSILTKKSLDELLARCAHGVACLYLIETSKRPGEDRNEKKIYKFGCSANVKKRMAAHTTTYGSDCALDTLIFLPADSIFDAETKLKDVLDKSYYFKDDGKREELALSPTELKTVQNAMKRVAETYYGTTMVHEHTVQMLEESHKVGLEKKNVQIANTNAKLVAAEKDVEIARQQTATATAIAERDITILQMKNETLARRIKELEEDLRCWQMKAASA